MRKKGVYNWRAISLAGFPLICFLLIFPFLVDSEESYLVYFLFLTFLYISLAQGWNVVAGYAGQPSLGQHAFFGLGAYLTAISWKGGWIGYLDPLGMLISGMGAAILAIMIGIPLLAKLRGDYFALGTLGLGEILRVVFTQGGSLTGGPVGLMLPSSEYRSMMPYYFIAFSIALLSLLCVWFLVRSRVGLALVAIREDEQAAGANGIHVLKFKIFAFAVGAFFTGLCGSLFAYYLFHIHPTGFFSLKWALLPVLMTILGGIGTIMGPIVGAFILAAVFELANMWLPESHPIFSGAFIILVMLFLPGGIMSLGEKSGRYKMLMGILPFKRASLSLR
ncbi:MAG: branched-chain amino acid ABC transporter permease [Desulfobacterales bacterium]|nr:branched-chain amino acid ABC transporter permease [Desulfobacterales bacterium]MBL7173390.1 branched-chain amino acid ABC transporter permease [Desulfobacteraceae bacterium]